MKKLPFIVLLLGVAGFIYGLVHLFRLRFESGDVYPAYSSLRADPLGTKALHDSLDNLISVGRHFQPLPKLGAGQDTTLLYLGANSAGFRLPVDEFKELEAFVTGGGRLVISFVPAFQKRAANRFQRRNPPPGRAGPGTNSPPATNSPPVEHDESDGPRLVSLKERWGADFSYADLFREGQGTAYEPEPAFRQPATEAPESILCHTAVYFDLAEDPWRVIYARTNERPVVIERTFGRGTIVLSADSYYFSNEALLKDRSPELLAWMIGPHQRVLFDETHLGVSESPGVAALGRKYRLHGLFGGLLLLAGLFVWKNATSFMPPYDDELQPDGGGLIAGKESAAGFVNLLRRNIAPRDLLGVCITEWNKSLGHRQPTGKLQKVQAVIDAQNKLLPKERNPIQTYQAISQIVAKPHSRK